MTEYLPPSTYILLLILSRRMIVVGGAGSGSCGFGFSAVSSILVKSMTRASLHWSTTTTFSLPSLSAHTTCRYMTRRTLIGAIPMVITAQSAANWHNTYSHGSHAFTHTLCINTVITTCCKRQLSNYLSVHAESFHVSIIHQTLT